MTEKTPHTLDRLWDEIPTGPAPIHSLLTAGHAAKRRSGVFRIVATVAAAAVVLGGGFIFVQAVPDGVRNLIASSDGDLDVRVDSGVSRQTTDLFNGSVDGQAAIWDAEGQTVVYVSDLGFSSGCPPEGTATLSNRGELTLDLRESGGDDFCPADASPVTVVIDGLSTAPRELTVTALGKTDTIPVARTNADDRNRSGRRP